MWGVTVPELTVTVCGPGAIVIEIGVRPSTLVPSTQTWAPLGVDETVSVLGRLFSASSCCCGLVAILLGEVRERQVALEVRGGLLRLIEPEVTLGDVPQLERGTAEAIGLLEVPDRVVVPALAVGPRALPIERPCAREIVLALSLRLSRDGACEERDRQGDEDRGYGRTHERHDVTPVRFDAMNHRLPVDGRANRRTPPTGSIIDHTPELREYQSAGRGRRTME